MAGWRKGFMAGLLMLLPYTVSTGTANSNHSLNKNSGLEEKVVSREDQGTSQYEESDRFLFYREELENGGKEIEAHIIDPVNNNRSSLAVCECRDNDNDGVYSNAIVYNRAGFYGMGSQGSFGDSEIGLGMYSRENFDLNVGINSGGNTFIKGINSYNASLKYFSYSINYLRVDDENPSSRERRIRDNKVETIGDDYYVSGMDSRKESVEKIGEIGSNKARYLVGACNELSNGNKKPMKEFLKQESSTSFYFQVSISHGEFEKMNYETGVFSDKVWNQIYIPGTIISKSAQELNSNLPSD